MPKAKKIEKFKGLKKNKECLKHGIQRWESKRRAINLFFFTFK